MTTADLLSELSANNQKLDTLNIRLEQTLNGGDTGGNGYYDEFWDKYQENGTRVNYQYAFYGPGWDDITFNPKHTFPNGTKVTNTFAQSGIRNFKGILERNGIYLDLTSQTAGLAALFASSKVEHIGRIIYPDIVPTVQSMLSYCTELHTIDELHLSEDGSTVLTDIFRGGGHSLVNITITGVIGQNGFNLQYSTNLSKASITNIIEHLSATASGLTLTLSKAAVNKAFESSPGANDGSTANNNEGTVEWQTLKATKRNWEYLLI
jgi:hypothetical protein